MLSKYKFVDDTREKIVVILETLQVQESRDFIADELKKIVSAHTVHDLLETLSPEDKIDYLNKFKSEEKETYFIKFREAFKEEELKSTYLLTFERVIKEFLSKAFPKIDSITSQRINEILKS